MTTIANQAVGNDAAGGKTAPGRSGGASQGLREGFLGTGAGAGKFAQVSAGTPGPETGAGGRGTLPMDSAPKLPGSGGSDPRTLSPSGHPMKEGKGRGASTGIRGTFL